MISFCYLIWVAQPDLLEPDNNQSPFLLLLQVLNSKSLPWDPVSHSFKTFSFLGSETPAPGVCSSVVLHFLLYHGMDQVKHNPSSMVSLSGKGT